MSANKHTDQSMWDVDTSHDNRQDLRLIYDTTSDATTSASDNDEEDGDDEATYGRDTAFPSTTVRMYTDATWPYR